MQNWLKRSLLVIGVFGICWAGAVWYWRSTTRMPDTGDLALAMLVMPVSLLTAVWLANKSFATAAASSAAGASVAGTQARAGAGGNGGSAGSAGTGGVGDVGDVGGIGGAGGATAAAGAAASAAWVPLGIAGAALRMVHGDSPSELASAIADGAASLDLDPELTDLHGFPLLAGRVPDLDTAPLDEWLAAQQPPGRKPEPHQLRAMALGGEVAARLAARARAYGGDGVLRLLPLLPREWPAPVQETAKRWLLHCAADAGWPQDGLKEHPVTATGVMPSPLAALRAVAAQPDMTMLLACDSSIDTEAVERLAVNGKLYGPRNPDGRMPAEGAAGILLLPPDHERGALRLLALQAAAEGEPATLTELAQEVLAPACGTQPVYVAADTDHRSAHMADLMQCVGATAPALNTGTSLACLGAACGHTGSVGAIAAIGLAHAQASDSAGLALALSNSEPDQRIALLVGPIPAPASKAPSLS